MREDYEPYFKELQQALLPLGYTTLQTTELDAQFFLANGWRVSFECERYYGPMFGLFVVSPVPGKRNRGYEVGHLMEAFGLRDGVDYGKPSLQNQASFLITHRNEVFSDPVAYDKDYSKVHGLP